MTDKDDWLNCSTTNNGSSSTTAAGSITTTSNFDLPLLSPSSSHLASSCLGLSVGGHSPADRRSVVHSRVVLARSSLHRRSGDLLARLSSIGLEGTVDRRSHPRRVVAPPLVHGSLHLLSLGQRIQRTEQIDFRVAIEQTSGRNRERE